MSIKGSFTPKTKKAKYGDQFTAEQKKKYWANKRKEIEKEKLEFVESVIDYAKMKKRFPWEEPNFVVFPQSIYKLKQIEKFESEHPGKKIPSKVAEYQGSNILRLNMFGTLHDYKDNRWLTLPQIWKLGGKISKFDQAWSGVSIWLVNPEGAIKRTRNNETGEWEIVYKKDENTGEYLLDKKGKKIPEKISTISTQKVYNVEVVTGLNLPPMEMPSKLDTKERCAAMDSIIENSEAPVLHDVYYGTRRYYSVEHDQIHLPPVDLFKSMTAYYATAAHEIGHSTGHESRLNRTFGVNKFSKEYAREEMVAEFTAVFLSQELGIQIPFDEEITHQEYLRSWNAKIKVLTDDPKELYAIISDAEKATKYIKEHMLAKELNHDKELNELKKQLENAEKTQEKQEKPITKPKVIANTKKKKGMER